MLSSRKRKGALTRKYYKDVVYKYMHVLDPEYLAINKYHADLKKDEDGQQHTYNLILNKPAVVSKEEMDKQINPIVDKPEVSNKE